jgi:hypothetical protein
LLGSGALGDGDRSHGLGVRGGKLEGDCGGRVGADRISAVERRSVLAQSARAELKGMDPRPGMVLVAEYFQLLLAHILQLASIFCGPFLFLGDIYSENKRR